MTGIEVRPRPPRAARKVALAFPTTPRPDNAVLRKVMTLPEVALSASTEVAVLPPLPTREKVTGDPEVDLVLWIRAVISTGHPTHIERAMEAKKAIATPDNVLERRYADFLMARSGGHAIAALGAFGFADLEEHARRTLDQQKRQQDALARFGSQEALFAMTEAEIFASEVLAGLKRSRNTLSFPDKKVDERFLARPEMLPHNLADALHELHYWHALYLLRHAFDSEPGECSLAREWFVLRCLVHLTPRSAEEAHAVFVYLREHDRMEQQEAESIIENLIKGPR